MSQPPLSPPAPHSPTPAAPRPGRPRALDDAKRREILALITAGYSCHAIADYIGCSRRTIQREINENPEFAQKFRRAKLNSHRGPLKALRRAARTHWRAAAWYLEHCRTFEYAARKRKYFNPMDVAELIDQFVEAIRHAVPDETMAENILVKVEGQVFHRMQRLLDEDPDEKRRRQARQSKWGPPFQKLRCGDPAAHERADREEFGDDEEYPDDDKHDDPNHPSHHSAA